MTVKKAEYRGFRNLDNLTLIPDEGVNIIYGENAQGKTNILEGIWLFSGLKSFRGAKDSELITFGREKARIKLDFYGAQREQNAEITVHAKRTAKLNGVELKACSGLIGKFRAVVFSPSFMTIIKNGPDERRKFIDSAICQLKPGFTPVLAEYSRLIKQRNSLIKDVQFETSLLDMLDCLDERISAVGERITDERKKYLEALLPHADEIYGGLSGGHEKISIDYIKKDSTDMSIADVLKKNRRVDILNKTTSAGPHRDDIDIKINGISARNYGSQGQQRSCAVALKLGEAAVTEKYTGERPVVLLDDVMSELDSNRQDYILNRIKERQVFITCCEPSTVMRLCGGKTFNIKNGTAETDSARSEKG